MAGAPKVMRAAFTKEVDFFARAGIEYVDHAVTLTEPHYFARQMFETWGRDSASPRTKTITPAGRHSGRSSCSIGRCRRAASSCSRSSAGPQSRRAASRAAVSPRPGPAPRRAGRVPRRWATRSCPSGRSPRTRSGSRFFKDDIDRGFVETPLSVQDVWPENYSTNSVQKVWAAKFAARRPNVVVLDLSSFKCGHDAPTYGMIDNIINSSGTPASALHDIDANKPGGSIKIRVKTYAHTLKRFEEDLADTAAKRTNSSGVAAKRRELLEAPARRSVTRRFRIRVRGVSSRNSRAAFLAYTEEDVVPAGFAETDQARPEADIAPPEPVHAVMFLRKSANGRLEARL